MEENTRYTTARKVTLVGAIVNVCLAVLKVIFGFIGQSQALIADGVHSFSDLLTDALVIFASRLGSQEADCEHPYGHQRIETAVTVILSILLFLVGSGIIWNAVEHLFYSSPESPKFYVLIIALVSILSKEALYRYTIKIGDKLHSAVLRVNAWHHRSDAASSIVVLIGVSGTLLGFTHLDLIAAIIVGLMIIKMGISLGWNSLRELVDTGLNEKDLQELHDLILSVPNVDDIHQLRTRHMGDHILVDVHVMIDPRMSVSEGHYIAANVHKFLMDNTDKVSDVTVHIDSENDEKTKPCINLPSREILLPELLKLWENCHGVKEIKFVTLHYLDGQINVEILLPLTVLNHEMDAKKLRQCYKSATMNHPIIEDVKILFS